ncbi:MAG: hypothetical protein F6K22_07810 [Okeania sp. SIO2F4]|uniref:hypothetical protein n=1 Tax=Okeania sp. SIO2F4 TaxID=2607790 RepID=UPI00142CB31E|nr:hypothetical protein [Okeania sp. SIO2F4]NES02761.1 hypothetical protein [Okeania sp. SIO2F4]
MRNRRRPRRDVACNVPTAGSKHQVVTLCDALYQFYGAVAYEIDQIFAFELGKTTTTRHI